MARESNRTGETMINKNFYYIVRSVEQKYTDTELSTNEELNDKNNKNYLKWRY